MIINGRVLLLNQTYEPLGTVSVARAIIMTSDSVTVEEFDGDRVLRSGMPSSRASVSPPHLTSTFRRAGKPRHEASANLHARQVPLPVLRLKRRGRSS